jgi:hypothetical protein
MQVATAAGIMSGMRLRKPRPAERAGRDSDHLFDPTTIDLVTLTPDNATVVLYIVQPNSWTGSDGEIASLQQKIHAYVGYANDGQMVSDYPHTSGLAWKILIDCQAGPPDPRTAAVLREVGEAVRRYGGDLSTAP